MKQEKYEATILELQQQIKLMRQMVSGNGFRALYFKELPNFETQQDAFNHVNTMYFNLFGEYRYSSYHSFRTIIERNYKK